MLAHRGDAQSVAPGHVVVAAACATFISAANRPHGRIVHKITPPKANTLRFDLNRLCPPYFSDTHAPLGPTAGR
jgi:hypothetical protein